MQHVATEVGLQCFTTALPSQCGWNGRLEMEGNLLAFLVKTWLCENGHNNSLGKGISWESIASNSNLL